MPKPKVKFDITAKDKTKAAFSKVNKGLGAMKLAGLAAGAALIAVFVKLSAQILKTGDQIHKLSIRLGISTEALSELRHVAELSGVKVEALTTGLQRMTRRVSEAAQGTGEAKNALKELGLDVQALARMKPDKMFETIADAIYSMKDPADKVRIAFKLFDTEGVGFLQMMTKGAAGIRELRKETKTVFSQQDANRIAKFNDTLTNFKDASMAATKTILLELIPAIQSLGTATTKTAGFFKGFFEFLKAKAGPQTVLADLEADLESIDKKIAKINKRITDSKSMKFWKQENKDKAVQDLMALHQLRKTLIQTIERERQAILKKNAAEKEAAQNTKKQADEVKATNDQIKEGIKLAEELQTPQEKYNALAARAKKLLDDQAISQETYNRALAKYKKELNETNELQEWANRLKQEAKTAEDRHREAVEKLNQASEKGYVTSKEYADIMEVLVTILVAAEDQFQKTGQAADDASGDIVENLNNIETAAQAAAHTIEYSMADAILSMKDGFQGLEAFIIAVFESIARAAIQKNIVGPLMGGIDAKFGSKGNGGFDVAGFRDAYNRNVGGIRKLLGGP